MPTTNQIVKNPRRPRRYKDKRRALNKCPQKKATCLKVTIMTPRKPNSALRKVAWVLTSNWEKTWAYICGVGHHLQRHSTVLIRGGRVKDLPGLKYTMIRGKLDFEPWITRFTARSKYGVKKARERTMKVARYYKARHIE